MSKKLRYGMSMEYVPISWISRHGYNQLENILSSDCKECDEFAIQWACMNGNLDLVKLLIDKGVDVTTNDNDCIKWAGPNGYIEILQLLIDNGGNTNIAIVIAKSLHRANKCSDEVIQMLENADKSKIIRKPKLVEKVPCEGCNCEDSKPRYSYNHPTSCMWMLCDDCMAKSTGMYTIGSGVKNTRICEECNSNRGKPRHFSFDGSLGVRHHKPVLCSQCWGDFTREHAM